MEDYDAFVQHRLSQLRKSEDEQHNKPSAAPSLIRFYRRPILPPLLSGKQREEMQRYRAAAQKAAGPRILKNNPRMAYVQTILSSVQLRKTQTLEELLQESEIVPKSPYSYKTSDEAELQSIYYDETKDSVLLLPPTLRNLKDGVSFPAMTSTTYSAFITSKATPHESYHEGCLIDQHKGQQGSELGLHNVVSHQSSGHMTYENVENTIGVSGRFDFGSGSHDFGSSEGVHNMESFFLHNTSTTIAKMPEIISYPPIDGEELERSGLVSSFSNKTIGVQDICFTSFQEDPVICNNLLSEKPESSYQDGKKDEENTPLGAALDLYRDHTFGKTGTIEVSENSPEVLLTLNSHLSPKTEVHVQSEPKETKPADGHIEEAEPSEEPYRLSLQALLKKSQEYRRRQRMLRNQAKNTKIHDGAKELQRARTEEQSHSDKENDEFPYKETVTAEEKLRKDKKGFFIPTIEMSNKQSLGNKRVIESEFVRKNINSKSESTCLTGDEKSKEMPSLEDEALFKNNILNSSQEVITEPKEISALLQQQSMSKDMSLDQKAFFLTSSPKALYKEVRKYNTIPVPNLCRSPLHHKSRASNNGREDADGAEKVVAKSGLNEDHKNDKDSSLGHQNIHTALASNVSVTVKGNETMGKDLAMSSQHIDQLESNLSNLKVLISESTVKENLDNYSQTESNTQNECSFEGINHSGQIKKDQAFWQSDLEENLKDDSHSNYTEYRQCPSIESFNNCQNMHKDTGSILCDTDDFPLIVQGSESERVNTSELRLVKAITLNRKNETGELTKTSSCRKQQAAAKCILSTAQWMRVPNVFRNIPPQSTVPCNVSVLSDTSNHPVGRRIETAVTDLDFTHTPSLNQSFDVDTPSDLWLLDQSVSDLGTKDPLVQGNHLTPESEGEGQGGMSKVKRRLLMYGTEETVKRCPDTSRCASSVVSPSIPTVPIQVFGSHGSQKDKQDQLKQVHAAQIKALQDEHRRQQEELLQTLAANYSHLQNMSFPCSMSTSRLGDTLTFPTLSQPSSPLSKHYRPLLSAAVKGFLIRRLLRTERVAQLVRTIRDTQQFLQAFHQQSPTSRQDLLLEERVTLQLRAARYEVYDIFFSFSAREKMQLISWDRELVKERQLRRQSGNTSQPRGQSSLSTATQKSLERKKGMITLVSDQNQSSPPSRMQNKVAEKNRRVVTRTGHKTRISTEQPLKTKRGQFRANPQRVSKSTYSTRPR